MIERHKGNPFPQQDQTFRKSTPPLDELPDAPDITASGYHETIDECKFECERAIYLLQLDPTLHHFALHLVGANDLSDDERMKLVERIQSAYAKSVAERNDPSLEIQNAADLVNKIISKPPQLIEGILYKGSKMSFNADSKMGKTWSLLHLAISLSAGKDWFGFKTTQSKVLFINPELQDFSFESRIQHIARECDADSGLENLHYITTRGKQYSCEQLLPILQGKITSGQYDAIILDSIYKLYPQDVEENSNSDVARFLNSLEKLAKDADAAIIYSHHYSKGNQSGKAAIDRSSGAGAWGRDPDVIVSCTRHSQDGCYTVDFNLRDFKQQAPIVVKVDWPKIAPDSTLDPKDLKTTQYQQEYSEADILEVLKTAEFTASQLQRAVKEQTGMSERTFYNFWPGIQAMEGVECNGRKYRYLAES